MSHQQSVAEAIKAYKGGETRLVIHGACTYYLVVVAARERVAPVCKCGIDSLHGPTDDAATPALIDTVVNVLIEAPHVQHLELRLASLDGNGHAGAAASASAAEAEAEAVLRSVLRLAAGADAMRGCAQLKACCLTLPGAFPLTPLVLVPLYTIPCATHALHLCCMCVGGRQCHC